MAVVVAEKEKTGIVRKSKGQAPKKKSKTTLFWEKYPNGIGYIVDHKAVLK